MRLALRGANPVEWLALRAGLVPTAAAEAWGGMALSGDAHRRRAHRHHRPPGAAAPRRPPNSPPTWASTRCRRGSCWTACGRAATSPSAAGATGSAARRGAGWIPASAAVGRRATWRAPPTTGRWWAELDEVTRTAQPAGHHDAPPGRPVLAALHQRSARSRPAQRRRGGQEASAADESRSLLDIGGGHGWYSAQLCRRYPQLTATVLDLPGSAAIGREIIAARRDGRPGRAPRRRRDHGRPGQRVRRRALLQPCAPPDAPTRSSPCSAGSTRRSRRAGCWPSWTPSPNRAAARRPPANFLGLFVYLSSGSQVHTPAAAARLAPRGRLRRAAADSAFSGSRGRPCTWSARPAPSDRPWLS